jgi:L-lactate dehydrogenase complex protein LldF
MSPSFRGRIRESLSDSNLQAALDANAERRVRVRKEAFASLDDPEGMRQQAHAIRAEVIDALEAYLEQFIHQAQANGMIVHRAADAGEAVRLVLEIARQNSTRLIAKSKTMVSEEIHLNRALEAAGLQVVETDLGEYIVQLRGEPPSHIITPAVHLTRADVGRLFQEKLNLPYTEDIPVMTAAARRVLREVFLTADIGISGVNFAVAETGTLCVLTNEGNGRMVTTLPRVHIALLGMERLVPALDDLALMLRLLPRSATGQKLTVYTSLLHGPRRPGDPDGPDERHVVILDNGRSKLRQSPLREMLYCIRCGACLNACPVFREIGGHAYVNQQGQGSPYPGPMGSVLSPALFGQAEFGQLARASTLCGACREACPVDIDLPRLLLRVRAGLTEAYELPEQQGKELKPNPPGWLAQGLRLFTWGAENPGRFRLAQKLTGGVLGGKGWLRLPAWSGWGLSKDFPRPAKQSFQERWKSQGAQRTRDGGSAVEDQEQSGREASLATTVPVGRDIKVLSLEARLEKLQVELEALGARFIQSTEAELAGEVLNLLQERGCQEILAWDRACLPEGMLDRLQDAGILVVHPAADDKPQAARILVGLTGAIAAAAETGSIAMTGGSGRPLAASLLPEVHIAVLRKKSVVAGLDELLRLPELTQAAAAVLVSGPSRTADIEMTLTIGVHGPGELIVLCY